MTGIKGVIVSADAAGPATSPHPIGVMTALLLTARLGHRRLDRRVAPGAVTLPAGMGWGNAEGMLTDMEFLLPLQTVGLGMGATVASFGDPCDAA